MWQIGLSSPTIRGFSPGQIRTRLNRIENRWSLCVKLDTAWAMAYNICYSSTSLDESITR
jgi:hypothetical protein